MKVEDYLEATVCFAIAFFMGAVTVTEFNGSPSPEFPVWVHGLSCLLGLGITAITFVWSLVVVCRGVLKEYLGEDWVKSPKAATAKLGEVKADGGSSPETN